MFKYFSNANDHRNSRCGQSIHVSSDDTIVSEMTHKSSEFFGGAYDNDGLTGSESNTKANSSFMNMHQIGIDLGEENVTRKEITSILKTGRKRETNKFDCCVQKRKAVEGLNPRDGLKNLQYGCGHGVQDNSFPNRQSQPKASPTFYTKPDLSTIGSESSSSTTLSNYENILERNRTINTLNTLKDLPSIVCIMRRNKNDPVVLEHACKRVQILAVEDQFLSGADRVGLINEVLRSMESFPKEVNLQLKGCIAVYYFSESGGENKVALNEAFAIESIIRCMGNFPNDGHIQNWAIMTLTSLSYNDQSNKLRTGVQNGIHLIIEAMKIYDDWEDIQQNAMKAIWTLSLDSIGNCFKVMDAGGAPVMMKACTRNPSVTMDDYFVSALYCLVCSNSMKIYEKMCDAGATCCLIKIIRHHRGFVQVLEKACVILAQLLHNITRESYKFVDNGGVPEIIQVMSIGHNSIIIQDSSCNMIRILAKLSTRNRQIIISNGGVDAVLSAIEHFPSLAEAHEVTSTLLISSLS